MQERELESKKPIYYQIIIAALLMIIILTGFVVRYPLVNYNLPVAANVDERTSLNILHRLETESLNPHFFNYPTFYFYMTHFVLKPADFDNIIKNGRLLSLFMGCGLAVATYLMAKQFFGSRATGLIAATLTMFSPVLILNGSYIITDVLFATLLVLALTFFGRFFNRYEYRHWLCAVLLSGLAVSTKYNAILVLISYVIMEFVWEPELRRNIVAHNRLTSWLNWKAPTRSLSLLALIAALVCFSTYLIPERLFISILQAGAHTNSVIDQSDMVFLRSMQHRMLLLGIAIALFSIATYRFPRFADRFSTLRPYAALFIAFVVFLMGTPYALISWKSLLYDFGIELKTNAMSGTRQYWTQYIVWYCGHESVLALLFAVLGLAYAVRRRMKPTTLLLVYLLLAYFSIGAARRGYVRYLTPILPVFFAFAAAGLCWIAERSSDRTGHRLLGLGLVLVCLILIGYEVQPKARDLLPRIARIDSMHESYDFVGKNLKPAAIYYSGYVPSFELGQLGYSMRQVSYRSLESGAFLESMWTQDVLLVDKDRKERIGSNAAQSLELIWSSHQDRHQYAYRRRPNIE